MANYYIKEFEEVTSESLLAIGGDTTLKNTDPYKKPIPAGNNGIINVIKDFSWFSGGTSAALTGLDKCPFVVLKEKDQILNSTLSQAIYYMNAVATGAEGSIKAVSKFSQSLGISADAGDAASKVTDPLRKFRDKLAEIGGDSSDEELLKSNNLASLAGIYMTQPTGFNYVMPYFDNPPNVSNNWGDQGRGGAMEGMINTGLAMVEEITESVNIAQPGVYIQKPKFFQHDSNGPEIKIQFPLFNTVKRTSKTPYQQNYELLWLLAYQNKTFKTSFGRSKPSKLYTVSIPGVINMPYAFISNLSIDFIGTVRNKEVTIANKTVKTPIPEAYNVSITVKSLLSDYANLMVGSNFYTDAGANSASIQSSI